MADDQGTGVPNGNFARRKVGRLVNRILDNVGPNGRQFPPLDAEPDNPEAGDVYHADGEGWDPEGDGTSGLFAYNGEAWVLVAEV